MGNPEHVRWILEGVEAWNERRSLESFEPDFEGVNLYSEFRDAGKIERFGIIPLDGIDLNRAKLANTDLSYAYLANADFEFAELSNAWLADSYLVNANFRAAKLIGAWLEGANLGSADLRDADLTDAKLINADLTDAKIDDTNFRCANLINADLRDVNLCDAIDLSEVNFAGTQPYKANLFSSDDTITPRRRSGRRPLIRTAETLLRQIKRLKKYHGETYDDDFALYFRGHDNYAWGLSPSVMRKKHLEAAEGEMLRDLIARRPGEFTGTIAALEQWVLVQHHGLPTRFLDVTRNPLVALLNACQDDKHIHKNGALYIFAVPRPLVKTFDSDAISVISNLAKLTSTEQRLLLGRDKKVLISERDSHNFVGSSARLRLYQQIRIEKPYFANRIDIRDLYKVFVVEPKQSSERIRAQSGAFLASAFHSRFERDEVLRWNNRIPVYADYKLEIPTEAKEDILEELELLNITNETLFPGLDSSAKAVKDLYDRREQTPDEENDPPS